MILNEELINKIDNGKNISFLIDFNAKNYQFHFTTSDKNIIYNNVNYLSGYVIDSANFANTELINSFVIQILKPDFEHFNEIISQSKVCIKILVDHLTTDVLYGFVSNISENNNRLYVEILSNLSKLKCSIGELFSPLCRECLGSAKCGIHLENYSSPGRIVSIISNDCFRCNVTNENKTIGWYRYGIIKFLNGNLKGISLQITNKIDDKIYLLAGTKMMNVGDEFIIYAGCDKTQLTCKKKFNNIINFRGEPFIGQ